VRRLSLLVPALAALAAAPRPAVAQPKVPTFQRTQLAEGVHALVFDNPLGPAVDGTALVVINDADVLVVDTQNTAETARTVIAEIRRLTSRPVRYVVNTHWHGDHHVGNQAYEEAFPGVEFIAHPNTRRDIETQSNPGMARFRERVPQMITDTRQRLAGGTRRDGTPLSAEERGELEATASLLEWLSRDAQRYRPVLPTITVDRELVLHRGSRTIEIRYLGRGNTRGDLVVVLPAERIVATGDLLVNPVPYSFGSYLGEWAETLRAVRALPVDVIVPGHGAIQRDRAYLDQVVALLERTLAQAKQAVARGLDLEGTRAAVNLDSLRLRFTNGDRAREAAFAAYFATPAVERAFREAKGELDRP
jgi:glyoxylase-like metal-dependent hydrolase (beta-lactamase superfamily II)